MLAHEEPDSGRVAQPTRDTPRDARAAPVAAAPCTSAAAPAALPSPDRGDALGGLLARAVQRRAAASHPTLARVEIRNGDAKFDVDPYTVQDAEPNVDSDKNVGLKLSIKYTPAESLRSDKIAFVQVMKAMSGATAYLFENERNRVTTAKDGEANWVLDRLEGRKSPIYGQANDGTAQRNATFGYRKSATDFRQAMLYDKVSLQRKKSTTFTVDAVSFAFDETNGVYLGGVSWGFATDAAGKTTAKNPALNTAGDPSGAQRSALVRWNRQARLKDKSKRNARHQAKVKVPGRSTVPAAKPVQ
jgi:hypothetical protein